MNERLSAEKLAQLRWQAQAADAEGCISLPVACDDVLALVAECEEWRRYKQLADEPDALVIA